MGLCRLDCVFLFSFLLFGAHSLPYMPTTVRLALCHTQELLNSKDIHASESHDYLIGESSGSNGDLTTVSFTRFHQDEGAYWQLVPLSRC